MTKDMVINAACDMFGYGASDFDEMSFTELLDYLDFDQLEEIKAFYGYSKLVVEKV
jgi:hypothetical protein